MTADEQNLRRLGAVRDLLLNPTDQSMQTCQHLLSDVIGAVSQRTGDPVFAGEVRASLQPIRFLLSKAATFWSDRHASSQPSMHYAPGGQLLALPSAGILSVEI